MFYATSIRYSGSCNEWFTPQKPIILTLGFGLVIELKSVTLVPIDMSTEVVHLLEQQVQTSVDVSATSGDENLMLQLLRYTACDQCIFL